MGREGHERDWGRGSGSPARGLSQRWTGGECHGHKQVGQEGQKCSLRVVLEPQGQINLGEFQPDLVCRVQRGRELRQLKRKGPSECSREVHQGPGEKLKVLGAGFLTERGLRGRERGTLC